MKKFLSLLIAFTLFVAPAHAQFRTNVFPTDDTSNAANRNLSAAEINERIGNIFNVKTYGAVGDGVTDDRAAIQTALDAAEAAGRGAIFFPAGHYKVGAPGSGFYAFEPTSGNIVFRGEGVGTTKITIANAADVGFLSLTDLTNVSLSGIEIDCNAANQVATGIHCIRSDNSDYLHFDSFKLSNSVAYGIGFQGDADFKRIWITNGSIINAGADGIDFKNRADTNESLIFDNLDIINPSAIDTGKPGIDIRGPATLTNIRVKLEENAAIGVRFRADSAENGMGGRYSSLSNFTIDLNSVTDAVGVVVDDPYVSVSDGTVLNGAGVNAIGVQLTGNAVDCTVSGVHVIWGGTANGFGFEVSGTSSTLIGNSSKGAGVNFRVNGTRNKLISNKAESGGHNFRTTTGSGLNRFIHNESLTPVTAGYAESTTNYTLHNIGFGSKVSDFLVNDAVQMQLGATASAVNFIKIDGGATGEGPAISVSGSESGRPLRISARSQSIHLLTSGTTIGSSEQVRITHTSGAVNQLTETGSTAGNPVQIGAAGTDTDINVKISGKGAGYPTSDTAFRTSIQAITGATAISLGKTQVTVSNGTGSTYAVTLSAPTAAEMGMPPKTISCVNATNTVTLATTEIVGSGGSTITFDTAGDSITLVPIQTGASTYKWLLLNNNGSTISAVFDESDFWRFAANDNIFVPPRELEYGQAA